MSMDSQPKAQDDTNNDTSSEATRKADSGVYLGDEQKSVLKDPTDLPSNQSILYPFNTNSLGEATIMESPLKYDEEDEEEKLANLYEGITEELSDNEQKTETNSSAAPTQSQSQPTEIHRTPSVHISTENVIPSIRRQPSVLVTPPQSPINLDFNGSSDQVHSLSALLDQSTGSNEEPGELLVEVSNPSHLFWVPASLHPEIAPNGFANWLAKHNPGPNVNNGTSGVKRRKSILSVSYGPEDLDKEEEEDSDDNKPNKPKRRPSAPPEPTKNMLQALQEQEQEAEAEGYNNLPTPNMPVLKRSMSLNEYHTAASNESEAPLLNRHSPNIDSPIIAGRTGLKRTARTNKRQKSVMSIGSRNDLPPNADGTSRRWGHRETQSSQYENPIPENERIGITPKGGVTLKDEPIKPSQPLPRPPPRPPSRQLDRVSESSEPKPFVSRLKEPETRVISLTPKEPTELERQPTSSLMENDVQTTDLDKGKSTSTEKPTSNITTPTNINSTPPVNSSITTAPIAQVSPVAPPVAPPVSKKSSGLFSRLFSDEKQEEKEAKPRRSKTELPVSTVSVPKIEVTEKDISSTVPLSNTKLESEPSISALSSDESQGNRKSFRGWLMSKGRSGKEKTNSLIPSDNSEQLTKYKLASRFPIHIERAIYRLSHFKLADPRRPLHHQVLISNLMFWYLSIIKQQTQNPSPPKPSPPQQQKQAEAAKNPKKAGKDGTGKKGRRKQDSIQKRNANGSHPNQRRASETAYRAPQYEIQAQQYRTPPPQPPPHQQVYSPNSRHPPQGGQMHMSNQQRYPVTRSLDGFRDDNESGDDSANDSETDHERGSLASFQPDSSKLFSEDENLDRTALNSRFSGFDMNGFGNDGSAPSFEGGRDSFTAGGQAPWAVSNEYMQSPKANVQGEYLNSARVSTENGFMGKGPAVTALSPISLPTSPSEPVDRRRSQSPGRQPEGAKSSNSSAMSKGLVGGARGMGFKGMRGEDDEDNVPLGMYRR